MTKSAHRPAHRRPRPMRPYIVGVGLCIVLFCLYFVGSGPHDRVSWKQQQQKYLQEDLQSHQDGEKQSSPGQKPHTPSPALLRNRALTHDQCMAAFPGLFDSVDDTVAEGPFRMKNTGDMGALQGRIRDGKIYILNAQRRGDLSQEMLNSRSAALHQLHRAIVTSPEPVPDTYFALNFQDQPFGISWGYSRVANPAHRSKDPDARNFLMPHFSFWAWKLPFVGSIWRAAAAIEALERETYPRLADKIPRAVWRGTTWFNSVHNPRLRQNLIAVTRNKKWADVEALEWVSGSGDDKVRGGANRSGQNASNALAIEDFCRYRYVLHTEGVAYSGRFQFLQMCASVTITPPIQWMQHTTHLVKPVFASELRKAVPSRGGGNSKQNQSGSRDTTAQKSTDAASTSRSEKKGSSSANAGTTARKPWPHSYPVEEANIVFVAPDWSDLEETIQWLEAHPEVAQRIAQNQRDMFVGGGYFSPAAEVCYWRALVRGWSKVVRVDQKDWKDVKEVSYEAFSLDIKG